PVARCTCSAVLAARAKSLDTIRVMPSRASRRASRSACVTPRGESAMSGRWTIRSALPAVSPWRIRKSRPTRRVYGKTKAPTERRLGLVSPRKDAMVSPRGPVVSLARHGGEMNPAWKFPRRSVVVAAGLLCALLAVSPFGDAAAQPRPTSQPKPEGEMRWALYVTLSPVWFDPGEFQGLTAFWVLYAIHDALVKPMPGNLMTPSLAEWWTVSADQRVYEFKLREGLKFHNGDAFTAEDVKFSFQRTKGTKILKEKVREITVVDPVRVRFQLHEPFPDFMAFYGTLTTGAGWIVPKKYIERVGDEGFKKHPIGLGPYRFVSHTVGVELIMEANEGYWRKVPAVKRLVFKVVPEPTTRAAMLKRGEVDVAYMLDAPQALELQRDPALRLAFSGGIGIAALDFLDMWDPKSPWADRRVRLAANHALDRRAMSEMETLGASKPTGSIVPRAFEFALPIEPSPYDPAKARQLLAEAGYPNGFDAGELHVTPPFFSRGEAVMNYLGALG